MFVKLQDEAGEVCVNMDTGLRFRPVNKNGLTTGVKIIFPDGCTFIVVRGDYKNLTTTLEAADAR